MNDQICPGLLVAVPHLLDPNFQRSVVLLLEENEEGGFGIVVNQDSPSLQADLCEDHAMSYSGPRDNTVRRGGPVQPDQGLVLYGAEHDDAEGREVVKGLQVSASKGTLGRLCGLKSGKRFHCFSGYAGWGPGQLEDEIRAGSWVTAPIDPTTAPRAGAERPFRSCCSRCEVLVGRGQRPRSCAARAERVVTKAPREADVRPGDSQLKVPDQGRNFAVALSLFGRYSSIT